MTNQETQGLIQSNYFVVGIKEPGEQYFSIESAPNHLSVEEAKEEIKRIQRFGGELLEFCIYHMQIVGTVEGEN